MGVLSLLLGLFLISSVVVCPIETATASPGNGLKIVGPRGETTPVVNERGRLALKVVDASGAEVAVRSWSSDNKDVGKVSRRGMLRGRAYGFASITAETARGPVSGFVVCARVRRQRGAMARGDTKADTGGNVYLSSPQQHVVYRSDGLSADVFAGAAGQNGYVEGAGTQARFDGPAGLGVDNRAEGGVYVADTANHCVRKIDFRGRSSLAVGTPRLSGTMHGDETPMAEVVMNSPRGVASVGSSLFVTDTENHCLWYVDTQRQRVHLVAGDPGESGMVNGVGRGARFNRPSGIAINTRGNLLAVADTGNNVIRLVGLTPREGGGVVGEVTTLGLGSSVRGARIAERLSGDRGSDQLTFDAPESISFDGLDNVYVVDRQTASVVTRGRDFVERVELAQFGTLGDPASVAVRRTQAFVLDEAAQSEVEAVNVVEVGAPVIDTVTPGRDLLAGGERVVVSGANFARETRLTLGDAEVTEYNVDSSTQITFIVPPQVAPGGRTLTVATRGGVAQTRFLITAPPLSELQTGEITTVYGGIPYLGDGGAAATARLAYSYGISIDGLGNIYTVNVLAYRIRRIDVATGLITTVAGTGAKGFSGDGGPATAAAIGEVLAIAVDTGGNLFFVDFEVNRIRRVDAVTGIITTFAGSDERAFAGDGGPIGQAKLSGPGLLAFDAGGNLYFTDSGRIRRVDAATGIVDSIAGNGDIGPTGNGGPAIDAEIGLVQGLTIDASGNIFVGEYGELVDGTPVQLIRRIDAETGIITAFAGNGARGYTGDGGPATSATLNSSLGLACDAAGNLFIAEYSNHVVRRVDAATGIITTVAGTGAFGFGADGVPARESALYFPTAVAVDGAGDVLVLGDSELIRAIDAETGTISTLAGRYVPSTDLGDGGVLEEAILRPYDVAFDAANDFYISDFNHRIRRVDAGTGIIETFAGTGEEGFDGDGGRAEQAKLDTPWGLTFAPNGDLYVVDRGNYRVRRIRAADRVITTVAGNGVRAYSGDGGPATEASFRTPWDLAVDADGNLFVADYSDTRVRRVDAATGTIATVAGNGMRGFTGNGGPAVEAKITSPTAIDFDASGSLLIVDHNNHRVRRVNAATGIIQTFAGGGPTFGLGDGGPATSATMIFPTAIAVDGAGNVFVFDGQGSGFRKRVRRIDAATGIMTTIAGSDALGYSGDGGPGTQATLGYMVSLAIDREGNLYMVDIDGDSIRVLKGVAVPVVR